MKKVLPALFLTSLLAVSFVPFAALAQDEGVRKIPECTCTEVKHNLGQYITGCEPGATICEEGTGKYIEDGALCCILDLMETVIDYAFVILLIVAGVIIVISAFSFATAAGAPDKVNAARDKLIWALIGIVVAFLSKGLAKLVEMLLT